MSNQSGNTYDNMPLSFMYKNEEVNGVLKGEDNYWTFVSKSPSFLKLAPSGMLLYAYPAPVPKKWQDFHKKLADTVQQMGYKMPLK